MRKQKRYYTYKFNSSRLKKFKYNIGLTIEEAIENDELIAIFENQIVDVILRLTNREGEYDSITEIEKEIKQLKKVEYSDERSKLIKKKMNEIQRIMHVPEYITIKMDSKSHYKRLYEKGVIINGVKYIRFNASASQARVNTVLFIAENIHQELTRITDNGRNLNKEIAPSKLNAYRGLYCSARHVVSTPRFCVVKDYESPTTMKVNFITEVKDKYTDDELEVKEITRDFNRFDGQGLISPDYAARWAEELGLKHTPSQFCCRGSFLKGMLCAFDFKKFCEDKNDGNYMIDTIYTDENGKPIKADLRDIDVIITESQLKLWDSWESVDHYRKCCEENGLTWGVTLATPEKDKTFFYENYQFLQTLNLDDNDIEAITEKFINWIKGVSEENIYYTMLFLMGFDVTEEKFLKYIKNGSLDWVKALIIEPKLYDDKYFKMKIYNMLKKRILDGSIGQIIVDGNFQVLVADPYAMMEHICGKEVKGLLEKDEHFSNYWNKLNVDLVVGSRSPLTYRSEHVLMHLKSSEDTATWYKHCSTGIIINIHGDETARFAGADHDYDILATTSDKTVIKGVYKDELPVVYNEPKPKKKVPTDLDLYIADTFSFDSIIGSLTNKSTTGYALLAMFEEETIEHDELLKRIKTITKAQSAQIDKTKIGQEVKGIVPKWVEYQRITDDMSDEEKNNAVFLNSIRMDKHPYFFKNLYPHTGKKYKNHIKQYEILAWQRLGMSLEEVLNQTDNADEHLDFIDEYNRNSPVIESDCVMNKICKRIESVDFEIRNLLRNHNASEELYKVFLPSDFNFDQHVYTNVFAAYKRYTKTVRDIMSNPDGVVDKNKKNNEITIKRNELRKELFSICNNEDDLVAYVVHMFYVDNPKYNKDIMWALIGDRIVKGMKKKYKTINVPVIDVTGDIEYLNEYYSVKEVSLYDNE